MCATITSITYSTYLETFAHVSPYFDNPLLSNGFITGKLVKGEIWNFFSAIILTLRHATVISVRHDCRWSPSLRSREVDLYTRGLTLVSKVYDVNPRWLLCDQGEFPNEWKNARVTPLYKNSGKRNYPSNYCPIYFYIIIVLILILITDFAERNNRV